MHQLDFADYISYMVSTKEIHAPVLITSLTKHIQASHPAMYSTLIMHLLSLMQLIKADKQLKRFERHVKRDVAVVHVRRFVLLVDNWMQTGARPPMIDHATQTWQVFQLSLIIKKRQLRINCPRQKLKPQDSYHEYASMWNVPLGG